MLTNYVYKLRPKTTQAIKMSNWVDMLRSHYNWCLNDRLTQYAQQFILGEYCDVRTKAEACPMTCFVSKNGATGEPWKDSEQKNPRRVAGDIQITSLPELKKARPWYAGIDSTVLQQNVKRLDIAYKNFFDSVACPKGMGRGFPKFKNRSNFTSFTYAMGVKVQGNKIYLPKLGWMRFHDSRLIPDGFKIKAATIRKRQDGWYVSIRIEDKAVPDYIARPLTDIKTIIGCDLGITKLVHLSDNHQIGNPKFLTNKKTKRVLKIRQRRVNQKVKGSNNRKKAAKKVGKLHKKIADKRQSYQWYVANKIVSIKVNAIAVEDLNISAMKRRCQPKVDEETGRFLKNGQSRKRGLNRSISDASWSDLILKIEYLAEKHGKVVIKINPKHTSLKCQNCGHVDASNRDGEKFICTHCGYMSHADINAAKNIRDRAFSIVLGDSKELESQGSKRPKYCKEISTRPRGKRVEPGNLCKQDIKAVMS
ncbi:RNA-guided endonuclease TnpB family protein [Brasilonema sp. UFV-L1]|uniref:RNA-guided endonuclease InsQ/TnpB family protein n=1 Tax=Brasilonema sp. UFV-L1 TaxID=2234130 RepID=UPI00145DEAF3|nr:RNA-guided endonuclease TnpB family protein [Brasilonema sp. UFV-L1]NMG11152.1 transposase [Brasilonema sp. UFV-L1]